LSYTKGLKFFNQCYMRLGDFMDAAALVNCGINFILYCVMSQQFRKTFVSTFGLEEAAARSAGGGRLKRAFWFCLCCLFCCCRRRANAEVRSAEDAQNR